MSCNLAMFIGIITQVIGNDFCDLINSYFLTQFVHKVTRISNNSRSILDLILCNLHDEIVNISVENEFTSDHLAVSFELLTKVKRLKENRRIVYNLKKMEDDTDASIACWYDLLMTCIDESVPKMVIGRGR